MYFDAWCTSIAFTQIFMCIILNNLLDFIIIYGSISIVNAQKSKKKKKKKENKRKTHIYLMFISVYMPALETQ